MGATSLKVVKIARATRDEKQNTVSSDIHKSKDPASDQDPSASVDKNLREEEAKLIDYGMLRVEGYPEERSIYMVKREELDISESDGVMILETLLKKLGIEKEEVVMSIPAFSSFVDEIILPQMPEEEISNAVEFEARSHVPVPITDVELTWQITGENEKGRTIMIVAVPKEVIFRYHNICDQLGITLKALEVETFSVVRALNLYDAKPVALIDIGIRNTTASLITNGFLRVSHNIETSGKDITKTIAQGLGISFQRAEELKKEQGLLLASSNPLIADLVYPVIDTIVEEIQRMIDAKGVKNKIEQIIITGGSASLGGLREYFQKKFSFPVDIANPWSKITYDKKLMSALSQNAPSFTTAVGLALY